ncbi:MAG: amino-acid N-acetyltransferase [Methylococcales bacterium]
MENSNNDASFVSWFRQSSPYIHAHRGRTFVICFGGEALYGENFTEFIHDIALLNSLGIRLVLVHGIRPQIKQRLERQGITSRYHNGLRITDDEALQAVKEAAGLVRVEIEADFSISLANSPMAGAKVRVTSGNFVTAKPLGIRDGIDFLHTGDVRRVDHQAISDKLDQNNIVLLSSIGYSPSGEVFNLSAEEVATATAVALKSDKLILLMEGETLRDGQDALIRQLTVNEAKALIDKSTLVSVPIKRHLYAALNACKNGVARVHLLDRGIDGAILTELFTRDGIGSLISPTPYEVLRSATIQDIAGILELITPLEEKNVLVRRSRETLEMEIEDFVIIERDRLIIGCGALHLFPDANSAEIACLALHPNYRGEQRGERLLDHLAEIAKKAKINQFFVLTTQTIHWFLEHGFKETTLDQLPVKRQTLYNYRRNSKVLMKVI